MLKYLPALIIAASQIPVAAIANPQPQPCTSFWVNPKTGVEECFDFKNGMTPIPVRQPQTTPDGYRFLTENEFGDRYFIRVSGIRKIGSQTYATARVRTYPKIGRSNTDLYSIWCDRRQFRTIDINSVTFYGGSQGSVGYAIWEAACKREQ
jgi:hypothetical protein